MFNINWLFSFYDIRTRFLNNFIDWFLIEYRDCCGNLYNFRIFNLIKHRFRNILFNNFNFFFDYFVWNISIPIYNFFYKEFLFEWLNNLFIIFDMNILRFNALNTIFMNYILIYWIINDFGIQTSDFFHIRSTNWILNIHEFINLFDDWNSLL